MRPHRPPPQQERNEALFRAIMRGNVADAITALREGADANAHDANPSRVYKVDSHDRLTGKSRLTTISQPITPLRLLIAFTEPLATGHYARVGNDTGEEWRGNRLNSKEVLDFVNILLAAGACVNTPELETALNAASDKLTQFEAEYPNRTAEPTDTQASTIKNEIINAQKMQKVIQTIQAIRTGAKQRPTLESVGIIPKLSPQQKRLLDEHIKAIAEGAYGEGHEEAMWGTTPPLPEQKRELLTWKDPELLEILEKHAKQPSSFLHTIQHNGNVIPSATQGKLT